MSSELPQGEDKRREVRGLFDTISPRYDLVNRVMTFGMDVGWRRRAVRELRLPGRSLVIDLACGTGDFCRELDRRGYQAVGFDFSHGMLVNARTIAPLVEADILRLPLADASVDGVTCGFALRNVVSLGDLFAELARVVRPGGRIALLDASRPDNAVVRAGHSVYFNRAVPMIGGLDLRSRRVRLPTQVDGVPPCSRTRWCACSPARGSPMRRVRSSPAG